MASINFEHVTKRYGDGFEAVKEMNLAVADGELMVLVGPSGSGKSTALRMVAGLEDITGGGRGGTCSAPDGTAKRRPANNQQAWAGHGSREAYAKLLDGWRRYQPGVDG